jgi:YebC/PmpR family DNA-binding regulatory protein
VKSPWRARAGGGDLGTNPRLRLAVEKAKAVNLPIDTVKRNIDKATGNLEGVNYEEIRYEGYGIGGAAIIVDTMTDNRVRTVAEVRHAFSKHGGNMGTEGSVAFQFKHCGQFVFAPGTDEDKVMEVALEAGAEDVVTDEDGAIEVLTAVADFEAVKNALEAAGLKPEVAEVTMRPRTPSSCRARTPPDAKAAGHHRRPRRRAGCVPQRGRSPNEDIGHRRRRPRTRPGVEAGPVGPSVCKRSTWRRATAARRPTAARDGEHHRRGGSCANGRRRRRSR